MKRYLQLQVEIEKRAEFNGKVVITGSTVDLLISGKQYPRLADATSIRIGDNLYELNKKK